MISRHTLKNILREFAISTEQPLGWWQIATGVVLDCTKPWHAMFCEIIWCHMQFRPYIMLIHSLGEGRLSKCNCFVMQFLTLAWPGSSQMSRAQSCPRVGWTAGRVGSRFCRILAGRDSTLGFLVFTALLGLHCFTALFYCIVFTALFHQEITVHNCAAGRQRATVISQ